MKQRSMVLLLIPVLLISLIPVLAQDGGVEIVGGDEASLRAFIRGMVGPGPFDDVQVKIYINQLPDDLPFELPLPDDTDVVGATVRDGGFFTDIMLNSMLEPEAIRAFYSDALNGEDWRKASVDRQSGGFRPGPVDAMFCYRGGEALLNIFASNLSGDRTDVRIHVQSEADPFMCAENVGEMRPPYGPDAFQLIPALATPNGMKISGQSGGGGGGGGPRRGPTSAFQSAVLEGDTPLSDLADFYNTQLEDAGWEAVEAISEDSIAWSSWTFSDDEGDLWAGTLLINANPLAENQYFALIQVNSGQDT